MSQLSFFSAEALPPALDDLEGLLAGPGWVTVLEDGAELSVRVLDTWRGPALLAALDVLGLPGSVVQGEHGPEVRTPVRRDLRPLAERWLPSGSGTTVPAGFVLDGSRLRWWCLAAGSRDAQGYVLRLGGHDEHAQSALGAALSAAGLAAVYLPEGARGPAYKVVGVRRLRRLAELVGPPPPDAPEGAWPDG